jgi:hypothetical protein
MTCNARSMPLTRERRDPLTASPSFSLAVSFSEVPMGDVFASKNRTPVQIGGLLHNYGIAVDGSVLQAPPRQQKNLEIPHAE